MLPTKRKKKSRKGFGVREMNDKKEKIRYQSYTEDKANTIASVAEGRERSWPKTVIWEANAQRTLKSSQEGQYHRPC